MAMPLVHRRIGRQAIEVAFSLDVIYPHALGALDHNIERMVVVGAKLVLQFDEVLRALLGVRHGNFRQ